MNKDYKMKQGEFKMAVLTAKCDRMFSVDKKQVDLFNAVKKNQKTREKASVAVSKITKKIKNEGSIKADD